MLKLAQVVICPVKVAVVSTTVKLNSSVKVTWSSPVAGKNVSWVTTFEVAVTTAGLPVHGLTDGKVTTPWKFWVVVTVLPESPVAADAAVASPPAPTGETGAARARDPRPNL